MEKKYLVNGVDKTREELFNSDELAQIDHAQKLMNDVGYGDINLTLLTVVQSQVSQQKFYKVNPEEFLPFDKSQGGWNDYITVLRNYSNAEGDIESWIRGLDADNARRGQVGVKLESTPVKINNLDKMVSWSLFELRQAQQTGVWNIITEKERARKLDHDLSIQKSLLLGTTAHPGLLTLSGVATDSSVLTAKISSMTAAQFKTFLGSVFGNYFTATGYTALPDTFAIATSDFMGLGAAVDETYPLKSMLERFQETFKQVTGNPNAKIVPLVYCEPAYNGGSYKYVLYRKDSDTLKVFNPVQYSITQGMTLDGMNYQNTAYSRMSDVFVNRPAEMLYMTKSA